MRIFQVRTLGLIYCLLILVGVGFSLRSYFQSTEPSAIKWPDKFPHGLSKPMLALEFAQSVNDVQQIVGDLPDPRRAEMLVSLRGDTFGLIPIYWLFFLSLSWLLAHRSIPNAFWLGMAVAVCASAAALFDFAENHYIRAALETPLSQTATETVAGIYRSSMIKWALIFVALGLLSRLFLKRRDLFASIGILSLLTSLCGLFGLIYHPAIEWAFIPLLITLLALSITFAFFPARFLQRF